MTTNYRGTFIQVAVDCPVDRAQMPPLDPTKPSVSVLQYELLAAQPYHFTSDELLFAVHVQRVGIPDDQLQQERERFFAKPQACLRSSPLSKRYGWGTHHDEHGRVALVGLGSPDYDRLAADTSLTQKRALRSAK